MDELLPIAHIDDAVNAAFQDVRFCAGRLILNSSEGAEVEIIFVKRSK